MILHLIFHSLDLKKLNIESNYEKLQESKRLKLMSMLLNQEPSNVSKEKLTSSTREVLEVFEAIAEIQKNVSKLSLLRNKLLDGVLAVNHKFLVNGSMNNRLPHNLNITFLDLSGSKLHKELKSKIICSSGSACSNGRPSHVLMALGRSFEESEASIRFSLGLQTTNADINNSIKIINSVVNSLKK